MLNVFIVPDDKPRMYKCTISPAKRACILLSTVILIVAFLMFTPHRYFINRLVHDTQVILHPSDMTKHVIQDKTYAIVFDGGSTGTRIHVFSFLIDQDVKTKKIILNKENFFYVNPGLSSYADNASEAASSLEPLLKKAYEIVPTLLIPQTSIILKATAGLRLLPDQQADDILAAVRAKMQSLPFKGEFVA